MGKIQYISRKGNFDSGHRVMNEFMKCYNIHGHTYLYELTFSFENMEEIGYAIDFKEIKPLVNSDGTAYVIGIKDNGQVFYTLVPSAGAIYSATSSQAWTRITAINGSATLTVTTNHHIISNL